MASTLRPICPNCNERPAWHSDRLLNERECGLCGFRVAIKSRVSKRIARLNDTMAECLSRAEEQR